MIRDKESSSFSTQIKIFSQSMNNWKNINMSKLIYTILCTHLKHLQCINTAILFQLYRCFNLILIAKMKCSLSLIFRISPISTPPHPPPPPQKKTILYSIYSLHKILVRLNESLKKTSNSIKLWFLNWFISPRNSIPPYKKKVQTLSDRP